MGTPVVMPKLGMTMREGTVIEWPVALGARVEKGQTVLVIESEKTEVEIEAIGSGYLRHIYVEENETVPCGTLLAALTDTPDEEFDSQAFRVANDHPEAPPSRAALAPPPASPARAASPGHARVPVTPAARKRAAQLGLDDVSRIPGTGPGGRVTREDVDAWARQRESSLEVAEGVRLEVAFQGENHNEVVLLLPGFGIDISVFAPQIPVLSERYRVLGVNPRGVGLSDAPERECYDVATAAADAAAAARGVAHPVHIVGTSLGAAVALEMALAHPDTVRSLALIAPFVRAEARLLAVLDAWCALAAEVRLETLARALLPWLFSPRYLSETARRERTLRGLAASLSRVPAVTLARTAAGLRHWSDGSEAREADLSRIAVPTCVIAGSGDLLTPGGEAVAEAIPGASCVTIPEAGHAVGLEAPGEVAEALLTHLAAG